MTAEQPTPLPLNRDSMLTDILRPPDEDISFAQRRDLEGRLGHLAYYKAKGHAEDGVSLIIAKPVFGPIPTGQDVSAAVFLEAARQELVSRQTQNTYFKRLEAYVPQAHTASDMVAITETYAFLRVGARGSTNFRIYSYINLFSHMLDRAVEIYGDQTQEIVDFLLPAALSFATNSELAACLRLPPHHHFIKYMQRRLIATASPHLTVAEHIFRQLEAQLYDQ